MSACRAQETTSSSVGHRAGWHRLVVQRFSFLSFIGGHVFSSFYCVRLLLAGLLCSFGRGWSERERLVDPGLREFASVGGGGIAQPGSDARSLSWSSLSVCVSFLNNSRSVAVAHQSN